MILDNRSILHKRYMGLFALVVVSFIHTHAYATLSQRGFSPFHNGLPATSNTKRNHVVNDVISKVIIRTNVSLIWIQTLKFATYCLTKETNNRNGVELHRRDREPSLWREGWGEWLFVVVFQGMCFFVSLCPFFHFAFGYLKDVLILPNIVLLFLLWILYIKLCQSFPSPNLVYSIMPPAHIEAENKQKGQKFWCVKTEVCRQACFINEIITLTKSTTISNSIFNNRMTNSQLQHILNLLCEQKAQYQMFTVWQWNTPFSNYFRKCCQHFVQYRRKNLTAPHKIKKFGNIFASFLLSQLRLKSVSRRSEEWCVGCPDHLFAPGNIKKKAKR